MTQNSRIENEKKSFVIIPGRDMGLLAAEDLRHLADIAHDYEVPAVKITGAQRIAFLGVAESRLGALNKDLGLPATMPHDRGKIHYVQSCPGNRWCKFGISDSPAMGKKVAALHFNRPLPYKVKVGISGCTICCCESWVRDVGLIRGRSGWKLIFGGNAAAAPRIGDVIAEGLNDREAIDLIEKCLAVYSEQAGKNIRSARFIEQFGSEKFRKSVLQ